MEEEKIVNLTFDFSKFRDPEASESQLNQVCHPKSTVAVQRIFRPKIRKRRKPLNVKCRPKIKDIEDLETKSDASTNDSLDQSKDHNVFLKRQITPIQEEHFQYRPISKSKFAFKSKANHEKVASLKAVVRHLRQLCLTKPEMVQNDLPEEAIRLFKKIHL